MEIPGKLTTLEGYVEDHVHWLSFEQISFWQSKNYFLWLERFDPAQSELLGMLTQNSKLETNY